MNCEFCKQPVDPTAPTTCQRVEAWERKGFGASRRGGSDLLLREHREQFAHSTCVERAKLGISPAQEALL